MCRKLLILFVVVLGIYTAGCATSPEVEKVVAEPAAEENVSIAHPVSDLVLLPAPQKMTLSGEVISVSAIALRNALDKQAQGYTAQMLKAAFESLDSEAGTCAPTLRVRIDAGEVQHAQGYSLSIQKNEISIVGCDVPGLLYGAMTLRQIARQYAGTNSLPVVTIEDWPDFENRGVMLDVARCKVPKMETLYAQVDRFAEWKFNQIQLYTEHTFAYKNHPIVWKDASSMTPEQIRALDAYCKERHIELVPNQNSFGHMNRWLKHERYSHLAETPGGTDLSPVIPESIELLRDMYDDLLPNFSSSQFNVGCDETWSLGKGKSKAAVEERGVGKVYFEFLMEIYKLCKERGVTMQFWGDIIMNHPELIPELPKDVIAMEWGYNAQHPFAEHGKKFAESEIPFYVVPGTSSWNSLVGRTDNALENLRNAAKNGLANGAIGYLVTDWGDMGHWQFEPVSYLPFSYGAGVSWAYENNKDMDITRAVDVHVFEDKAGVMGQLAYDLGNAHKKINYYRHNRSFYYSLLAYEIERKPYEKMTVEGLKATLKETDAIMARLSKTDMHCEQANQIFQEFELAGKMIRFACHLGIVRIEDGRVSTFRIPENKRKELAAELAPIIPEFKRLWRVRNREGGLAESAGHFDRLMGILSK